jgi:GntR family negative regulator for fad regulon and positive regulator of fabA
MTNSSWLPPEKPAELTERRIITAILDGSFPVDSFLPAERELAEQLGVTRPTLREALQRLARDGWLEIRQGKPTRVRKYSEEGNLAVLAAMAQHQNHLPSDFVPNLLYVRILMAPAYTRLAIQRDPNRISTFLQNTSSLDEDPVAFSVFDWQLHHTLTIASENSVFTLILNGFQNLYSEMGNFYFSLPEARVHSRTWYTGLQESIKKSDPEMAARLTEKIMRESLELWNKSINRQVH